MESSKSGLSTLTPEQLSQIQQLIDSKVDEKFAKFQADYDELMKKVKGQVIGAIKPTSLFPRANASESKAKATEESKDTLNTSSLQSSRPTTATRKSIATNSKTSSVQPTKRSDSKESQKSKTTPVVDKKAAEEKKKEQLELKRQEEERKKEESRVKREEMEKKRKEEADKKKQAEEEKKRKREEDKIALERSKSQSQPPAKQVGGKKQVENNEDDPIDKSLNERIKAGGVTQVITKPGGAKPAPISQPGLKKNPPAAKDSSTDGLPNPVPTPKGKDAAQKQENFKPQFARKESVAGKKGGKDDDSDDPIAKSLALRIKAGGISEVISQAEAKKLGLIKTTVTAPADKNGTKPTSNATTDKKAPGTTAPANGTTEEKKQGTAVKDNKISKPAPAIQKGTGFGGDKKKGAADEADPIEESLKLRIKAGGLTEVVPLDKKAAAAQATKKDAPKTAEKKEEKKEAPKTTAPATQTKVQSPTTNTTATTDKTKNSVDDAKRRQSVGTASTLTNVPKVMKGKKKNEDSEKKDDENEATVSTHQNAQGEDQINSQADDDTKQSLNGEATGDVENNHTENNAEEEVEAQEEEQPKEEQQEQEEDPYERQEQVDEQVQEQEEEQQVAEQQEAEQNGHNQAEEVDLEQVLSHVLELQSLLDQTKPSNVGLEDLKLKGAEIVKSLRDQLLAAVQDSETQAKASGADGEKQVDPSAFQTSKNTNTCCIEFLQENDVETASWIDEADGHDKLKKILKVFFSLISTYNSESWCSFPTILNDDLFYAGAKQALLTDAVTLSPFFTNCLKNLDLSNENLLKVSLLLSHFDDLKEDLDPAQSVDDENQAELNMTFFLYVIKDILEYFGMYPTTSAGRQQQHALTRAKLFKTKSDYLTRVLAQLE